MPSLATEFPIQKKISRSEFIAQVVTWLKGTDYSKLFAENCETDTGLDTTHLSAQNGEELRLREFSEYNGSYAIGFRHDLPDSDGRLWRTEAVLRRDIALNGQDLIRLRTECISRNPTAILENPRKPYLIKTLIRDGLGGHDGKLTVSDEPIWLPEGQNGLEIAHAITEGTATHSLPVIYISATNLANLATPLSAANRLAFELGGIAHIVMEPSRNFSFDLRDITNGQNPYGGTIAIALPGRGIVRRFFPHARGPKLEHNLSPVRFAAINIRNQMPANGWDWTELQEQALRQQRIRDRNRLSTEDTETLYLEEIENLKDSIRQLKAQQDNCQPSRDDESVSTDTVYAFVSETVGPEIYSGEFIDRIRRAARECADRAGQIGLDRRSIAVLNALAKNVPASPALGELKEDLKRATRDPNRAATELVSLLSRHGYHHKSDNKHIRLEANNSTSGLAPITLPKTPSDFRSSENTRKQIERALGITKNSE